MNKKSILYVIDSLARGGAETLLVGILEDVKKDWNVILVSLSGACEFDLTEKHFDNRYSLGYKNKYSFPNCILQLRKIIKKHRPSIVHAHLLNSSIIARFACPKNIPLAYSIHSILSLTAFNNSWIYRNLEKIVFKKNHYIIAVSPQALADYKSVIGLTSEYFILKNYISDPFFYKSNQHISGAIKEQIKMVAVGNIKPVKNYDYLLGAMSSLKKYPISLDIYGRGEKMEIDKLQARIDGNNLPVVLKGQSHAIHEVLNEYDLYVLCSLNEGFGLAAAEAMAVGVPMLLSDLPVLREITENNALFFDPEKPESFVNVIKDVIDKKWDLKQLSDTGKTIAKSQYSKSAYLNGLYKIYEKILR